MFGEQSPQLHKGTWMHKPGSKGGGFRIGGSKWNRRYVWVENNAIHYGAAYRKPEKSVPLNELKSVRVCTDREITDEKGPAQFIKNGWRLSTRDKVIIFVAEQLADRDTWVMGLNGFLHKTHDNDLDDDDEATYRQLAEDSSRGFADRRSMSVYSAANFDSDDVEQLFEEEEAVRVRIEEIFRKGLGDIRNAYFDEMENAITAETVSASVMRSRSQSMAYISRSPSALRPDNDDDDTAEAQRAAEQRRLQMQLEAERHEREQILEERRRQDEAEEAERRSALEEQRRQQEAEEAEQQRIAEEERKQQQAAYLQNCVEAQNVLSDAEATARLSLEDDAAAAESELCSQERRSHANVIVLQDQRQADLLAAARQQQAEARLDFVSNESETRNQLQFSEERDATVLSDAKAIDYSRAQKREKKRLGDERQELERCHLAAQKDLYQGESTARKIVLQDEVSAFTSARQAHDASVQQIRIALAQQLQDESERFVAAQSEERLQFISLEAARRSDAQAEEETGFNEMATSSAQEHADAVQRTEVRITAARAKHEQQLEAERQDLVDDEGIERGEADSEARDAFEEMASQWVVAERQVNAAVAKRIAAEVEATRLQHLEACNALFNSESEARDTVALEETRDWSKAIVNAAQASKRKTEQAVRDRLARTAASDKKARDAAANSETSGRQTLRNEEANARTSLNSAITKGKDQAKKREAHRRTLEEAARTYEEGQEVDARAIIVECQSTAWTLLAHHLSLTWGGHYGAATIIEEEISEFTALQISMDCGADEAAEATSKREAATASFVTSEEQARDELAAEADDAFEQLHHVHAAGQQLATSREEERVRQTRQFHSHHEQKQSELETAQAHDWGTILADADESKSQVELLVATRMQDAAAVLARTHELERKSMARSEAEGRIELEDEAEAEFAELGDAFSIGRDRVEARLRSNVAAITELLEEERTTRLNSVATLERDERSKAEDSFHHEKPAAIHVVVVQHVETDAPAEASAGSSQEAAESAPQQQQQPPQASPNSPNVSPGKVSSHGEDATPSKDDDRTSVSSRTTSDTASTRNSANRRSRAQTITMRQEAQEAAKLAEEQYRAERASLEQFVQRGCWMFKPGSSQTSGASSRWFGGSKWNKRYVWVKGTSVLYGEKPEKPEKPLPFSALRKVSLVSALDAERENCPKELRSFVWKLTSMEKIIYFACQSERDRNNWIKYLEVHTKQQDMESTVGSVRSFAPSLTMEQSGWNVGDDYDGDDFEYDEEEEDDELVDPFDEGDPLNNNDDALSGNDSNRQTAFVAKGAAVEHLDDDAELPQTFEGWCELLHSEQAREREDLVEAEERHRARILRESKEVRARESTLSVDDDAPIAPSKPVAQPPQQQQQQQQQSSTQQKPQPAQSSSSGTTSVVHHGATDSATSSQTTSATRRDRGQTIARRDEAAQKRADAIAAAIAAETAERERIVTTGAWMYKPRSKSATSSIMRSISSIGGGSWNKRYMWVDVRKNRILYGEKPGKPEKEVPLKAIQSIYALPPDVMKREGAPKNLWSLGFKISADDRSIMWAATESSIRKAFIDYLTPVAKRQPSGLQPRAQAYGSLNNDLDDEDGLEDPFADDYDEDYDPDYDEEARQEEEKSSNADGGAGGPTSKKPRGGARNGSAVSRSLAKEPVVPLMSMGMFLNQLNSFTHLSREEGLIGVGVANGEGLLIQSAGEVNGHVAGRAAKISSLAHALHLGGSGASVGGDARRESQGPTAAAATPSPRPRSSTLSGGNGGGSIVSGNSFARKTTAAFSILVEIEGPHHQIRTLSLGSASATGDLVCVAVHQNPQR